MSAPRVDIAGLKSRISLESLVRNCGVELKKNGPEWLASCPFHVEKTPSFKITPSKDLFYCAGCNAGGDHIKFLMEYFNLNFKDAVNKLEEMSGGAMGGDSAATPRESNKTETAPLWVKSEAPSNPPDCPRTLPVLRDDKWIDTPVVNSWPYRNTEGALIGYTCRVEFEKPDGEIGKDVIPVSWQTNTKNGESKWRQGAFDVPRPLYGAELLKAHPDWNVVLVEGEKACDAARRLLAIVPVIVMTWAGGCKAVEKSDWTVLRGRKILSWPDTDSQKDKKTGAFLPYAKQPGMAAMLRIAEITAAYDAQTRIVEVDQPSVKPDGWDLYDAEHEGWTGSAVMDEIKAKMKTPAEILAVSELPQSAPDPEPETPDMQDAIDEANAAIYASKEAESAETGPETSANPPKNADKPKKDAGDKPPKEKKKPVTQKGELPVTALGYNHGRYYYLSNIQRQVHEYQKHDHTSNGMMQLAPLSYWGNVFSTDGVMKGEHWQAATDCLMRACEKAKIFDTAKIRGRGCWIDKKRLAINLGNRVIIDGQDSELGAVKSDFIYEAGATLSGPAGEPLTAPEARLVLEIAKRFNWEMPGSAALLAGWVVLAPLCGSLPWRPHIWLTGGTGTGKSTILEKFIAPLMAGMELQVQGNSTEAGIRQVLRADARPVIFDESEQNEESDERRIQNVLALARQSSSESQSRTLKGTTSGKHLEFHIRSMFCLASIQVGIKRQADQTRIGVLGLYGNAQVPADKMQEHQSKWLQTEGMLAELRDRDDFAGRLMARSVKMYGIIRQNMKTMIKVAAKEFQSQRLGDQYGTLLGGAAALMYDHPISEEGAQKFIKMFDWSTHIEGARDDESARALTSIMQVECRVDFERGSENRTIGELVSVLVDNVTKEGVRPTDAATVLGRIGVKVKRGIVGKDCGVLVANSSEKLQKALKGAPWAADWRSYLKRLPGAHIHDFSIRFSEGYTSRCVFIPVEIALPPDLHD